MRQDLVFSFRIMNGVLMARPVLKSSIPKLFASSFYFLKFLVNGAVSTVARCIINKAYPVYGISVRLVSFELSSIQTCYSFGLP